MRRPTKPVCVRVRFSPTERTDLICIGCGTFRTDYAIAAAGAEPQVGLHRGCVGVVRIQRGAA